MFVYDLYFEARGRFGCTTCFRAESVQVFVVAADNPSAFGLPVVVVDQHSRVLTDPFVCWDVASLAGHRDVVQTRNVVLPDPVTLVVLPPDCS